MKVEVEGHERDESADGNAIAAAGERRAHHQKFDLERHPKKAKPTGGASGAT